MNWIVADELAKAHLDALHRAAGGGRPRWERAPRRPGRVRRALGVRFVGAGLALAAGVRAAKAAPDVVCNARDSIGEPA